MEEILEELKTAIRTELPYMSCDGTLNIKNREWNDALYFVIKKLKSSKAHTDKVVIPQFVADCIEHYKRAENSLGELLAHIEYENLLKPKLKMISKVMEWVYPDDFSNNEDRIDLIARAWLDGYEVEKEKKYRVVFRSHKDDLILFQTGEHIFIGAESANSGNWKQHFTESEIKEIDIRYWEFAEEVTE